MQHLRLFSKAKSFYLNYCTGPSQYVWVNQMQREQYIQKQFFTGALKNPLKFSKS